MAASHFLAPHKSRWVRILGVAFIMYILAYIDRTNISMAIPAMRTELGLSSSAIGFATGMFFWGYIVLQIPAGRLAAVWSAKWVIFGLLMFWSIASFSTAFVRTENQLIANRFILGLFEGGVLTCTIVLIRKWFTRKERARANTLFLDQHPARVGRRQSDLRPRAGAFRLADDVHRRSVAWTGLVGGLGAGDI